MQSSQLLCDDSMGSWKATYRLAKQCLQDLSDLLPSLERVISA